MKLVAVFMKESPFSQPIHKKKTPFRNKTSGCLYEQVTIHLNDSFKLQIIQEWNKTALYVSHWIIHLTNSFKNTNVWMKQAAIFVTNLVNWFIQTD